MTCVHAAARAAVLGGLIILQPGAASAQGPDLAGRWVIAKIIIAQWIRRSSLEPARLTDTRRSAAVMPSMECIRM